MKFDNFTFMNEAYVPCELEDCVRPAPLYVAANMSHHHIDLQKVKVLSKEFDDLWIGGMMKWVGTHSLITRIEDGKIGPLVLVFCEWGEIRFPVGWLTDDVLRTEFISAVDEWSKTVANV